MNLQFVVKKSYLSTAGFRTSSVRIEDQFIFDLSLTEPEWDPELPRKAEQARYLISRTMTLRNLRDAARGNMSVRGQARRMKSTQCAIQWVSRPKIGASSIASLNALWCEIYALVILNGHALLAISFELTSCQKIWIMCNQDLYRLLELLSLLVQWV